MLISNDDVNPFEIKSSTKCAKRGLDVLIIVIYCILFFEVEENTQTNIKIKLINLHTGQL